MFRPLIAASLLLALVARADNIPTKPEPVKPPLPIPLNPATKPTIVPPKPDKAP